MAGVDCGDCPHGTCRNRCSKGTRTVMHPMTSAINSYMRKPRDPAPVPRAQRVEFVALPSVETVIEEALARHPRMREPTLASLSVELAYYTDVHQHITPLARALEAEVARLTSLLKGPQ